jgi:hypothetical protein
MKRPVLLLALLCSIIMAGTATAQTYQRTVIVSPVPGDPAASGQALLAVLENIPAPSESDRWLIKIEPGIFDLGDSSLLMREWVDIEGSGNTEIQGRGRQDIKGATVIGANHAELRELSVVTRAGKSAPMALGILLQGVSTRVHRVKVRSEGGTQGADGVYIVGGAPRLTELEIECLGSPFASGIVLEAATSASISASVIRVYGAGDTNRGILLQEAFQGGEPMLHSVHISASGGRRAYGLVARDKFEPPAIVIEASTLLASGASEENAGVAFTGGGGAARLVGSVIEAAGAMSHGVWVKVAGAKLRVSSSEISGDTAAASGAVGSDGDVLLLSSLLAGGPTGPGTVCAGVTDENGAFYADTCP